MSELATDKNPLSLLKDRLTELMASDPQIKAAAPLEAIQRASNKPNLTTAEIIHLVLEGYADRPALGERSYQLKADSSGRLARQLLAEFNCISYRQLYCRIKALANAWRHHQHHRLNKDEFVIMLGFSGIDFVVADMASTFAQTTTVPLQTTLSGMQLENIFRDCAPSAVFATITDLQQATEHSLATSSVRSIVAFEYDPLIDAERELYEAAQATLKSTDTNIQLTTIDQLIEFGNDFTFEPLPKHPQGLERVGSLMHSSGSTGTPKGVIITERILNFGWLGTGAEQSPTITTVFAPLNHFLGRSQVFSALTAGGTANFTAAPDMTTLFEDIRLTRPTFLFFFPRVLELIYQFYQSAVLRKSDTETGDRQQIETMVRAEMHKTFLGDRLRAATFGSAPTPPEIKNFMRDCFDILFIEGYGSTESGIMTTQMDRVQRPPVIDYKLRDVPELGYYTTDKPYPRGELLVKSMTQSPGFFKLPEETAALFDEQGYVITGDIMEERGLDHIVYIDRRNDVLKLSQAEFVVPGKLAASFEGSSQAIHQLYIYGNSSRSYLLAVVVPDTNYVATKIGADADETELKSLIRKEMQAVVQSNQLRSFELPRDFLIEYEPFSFENGLLSSVRKRMRPNLKRKYGDRLEALYEHIENKRHEELLALKDPDSPLTVLEKVLKAIEASLGIEGIDVDSDPSFAELGGDSLGSVSFSVFLQDIFGVELAVNAIVSPAGNPKRWAKSIEAMLSGEGQGLASFESTHGKAAKTLQAGDMDIVRFLDQHTLDNIPTAPPPAQTRTVLLTGANGFLGRFLCLQWMERVAPLGGKVICLIRANSNEAARKRLDQVFAGVDTELQQHYQSLAENHLEVIAGDIGEHNFGVDTANWNRLADEVDHIVHPAALVNHVLSYQHLFGPNVVGTAELIRLALTKRQKRFDFVSSMAVGSILASVGQFEEESTLPETLELTDGYAGGYGLSKWASEIQLHTAHQRYGLPINIYRGDMLLAHSHYKGQINVPDMFTRLLYSIIMTGLAPASFYESGADGSRASAHYDALPCDFVAAAIAGIGAEPHNDIRIYNTLNHHFDDGISLDSVVDWVQSAGYGVEREPDHERWFVRMEEKLNALSEAQRQLSSVAIMHQFQSPHPEETPPFDCRNFTEAVRGLPIGPEVPHLNEQYIHKYLRDMRLLQLIPEPK